MTLGGAILACDPKRCPATLRTITSGSRFYVHREFAAGRPIAADSEALYWAALDGDFPDASAPDGGSSPEPNGVVHHIMKLAK